MNIDFLTLADFGQSARHSEPLTQSAVETPAFPTVPPWKVISGKLEPARLRDVQIDPWTAEVVMVNREGKALPSKVWQRGDPWSEQVEDMLLYEMESNDPCALVVHLPTKGFNEWDDFLLSQTNVTEKTAQRRKESETFVSWAQVAMRRQR